MDKELFMQKVKEEAEIFIKEIESGEIKKRTLPNTGANFSHERAAKSFNTFINSEHFDEILKRAYNNKDVFTIPSELEKEITEEDFKKAMLFSNSEISIDEVEWLPYPKNIWENL